MAQANGLMGVSVIVCCYNSKNRLYPTLKHLSEQQVPPSVSWEVVLVNNNSTDETEETARKYWNTLGSKTQFSIVNEPQPGLSTARRRGLEFSRFPFVIFCDDDNWLCPEYVAIAFVAMLRLSNAAVIGGHGKPVCEVTPPEWFERYASNYATGPQSTVLYTDNNPVDVTIEKGYVYGASAVFRKSALEDLYKSHFRQILTDRIGNLMTSGGDNELCYALKLRGYRIYFHPSLIFHHFIPADRLTIGYLLKLNRGFGYSYMLLLPYLYKITKKRMHGVKVSVWWLLSSSLCQFTLYDLPRIIFKGAYNDLNFRVELEGRKGAIEAFWHNRNKIKKNFKYVSGFFSTTSNSGCGKSGVPEG